MISATSLNAPSPLNKGHQIPLGLDTNGRLRVDSQKFLVPSLPVSARAVGGHNNNGDPKRRERSIVNGTAHPQPSPSDYPHHHPHNHPSLSHNYQNLNMNGYSRASYNNTNNNLHGGRDSSPSSPQTNNNHRTSSSPHHPYLHLNNSPRKDAHSPMYAGEVPGHGHSPGGTGGGNYSNHRSSMPIPCSSPAQASSASPKGSHSSSHSPQLLSSSGAVVGSGNYSPKLPSGPQPSTVMLPPPPSELSSLATAAGRLYPGFPPPHPSVAAHLSPAFYAAAAAAAASHSLPYPIFGVGPSFNPHSHSAAAASAYLDSFHSALVHRGPQNSNEIQHQNNNQQRSRSPSPSPPIINNRNHHGGIYHPAQQQQPHPQSHPHPHSHLLNNSSSTSSSTTSVTSLHNKLIESTTVSSSDRDRHGYNNGHNHHHQQQHASHNHNQVVSSGQFSPQSLASMGLSKGGPLGISGGIMNLPSSRLSNGGGTTTKHATGSPQQTQPQPENLVVHKTAPQGGSSNGYSNTNLSSSSKQWLEHHGLNPNDPMNRKLVLELEARQNNSHHNKDNNHHIHAQVPHKLQHQQRVPSQSPPQDMTVSPKIPKNISFSSDTYPSSNRYPSNPSIHNNANNVHPQHHHHPHSQNPHPYAHLNGHHQLHHSMQRADNAGILTDSNHAKKQVNNNHLSNNNNNNLVHTNNQQQSAPPSHHHPHSQPPQHNQNQSSHSSSSSSGGSSGHFLPPSPKKRAGQWNFAVPANPHPGSTNSNKVELPPPPPPPPLLSQHFTPEQIKYLNNSSQNLNHNSTKPSNNNNNQNQNYSSSLSVANSAGGQPPLQSAQHHNSSYPSSPRSGPSTPKSPAVHQVKFSFSSGSSKENVRGGHKQGGKYNGRNDSSSSTSSNEGNVPWPVEQMPILEAFRRGSLIKLANGDLRPVEDLKAEDFVHAAANMSTSLKIIHCTVLSIQQSGNSSLCKVTMTVGSQLHNQQVIVPSSPEQPFFVLGRGWSSLSPKTTEKLLQLPCCSLAVGDVCITLSKTTPPQPTPTVLASKGQNQVPKSPSTRGRKPGSGRGGANNAAGGVGSPTTKRAIAAAAAAAATQQQQISLLKQATGENKSTSESIKRHSMGPPLTTGVVTTSSASGTSNVNLISKATKVESEIELDAEKDGLLLSPPSPKRRRWSAPEPDIPLSTPPASSSADGEADKSIKDRAAVVIDQGQKQSGIVSKIISPPLTPSSSSPPPLTCQKTLPPSSSTPEIVKKEEKDEDERTLSPASDKAMEIEPSSTSTDVNSNVNVKDNVKISTAMELDQTTRGSSSSDAQSAKA